MANETLDKSDKKTLERLTRAIEAAYHSPSRMFWRGFLWGFGRGIGNLIGWLLLLAILVYIFRISGLSRTFDELFNAFNRISQTLNALPRP